MRIFFFSIIVFLLLTPANANQKRVALVVGNSAYQAVAPLPNPQNDASAIAHVLERLGFEVILGINLNHRAFISKLKTFSTRLDGADLALFFFAGHGLQVDGKNYLVPIDTELEDEIDLEFETVRLDSIVSRMENKQRTSLVFLDACRNNPLARNLAKSMGTRSIGANRGLATVETGVGTLIAYSTQPGNVAYDGKDDHSPFSAALLEHLEAPGADIAMVLRRVRRQVLETTNGKQVPWSNSSLTSEVVLKAGLRQEILELKQLEEQTFWNSIRSSNDPVVMNNYLKRYPTGSFVEKAITKIEEIKKEQHNAQKKSTGAKNRVKSVYLDKSARIALQMSLKELGYDPGPANGRFGPNTFKAIMDARIALALPPGNHVDQQLISLLPDISKLYGAYDGDWIVVRTANNPGVCGWSQVKQRLKILDGAISGPGYTGEIYSDGTIEMKRSFIQTHKKRLSSFRGGIFEKGGAGKFSYDFNACNGDFVLRKGEYVSLSEEEFYKFDTDNRSLVRNIQTELNRLGCDVGLADGVWGEQSRLGLQKFSSIKSKNLDVSYGTQPLLETLSEMDTGFCREPEHAGK